MAWQFNDITTDLTDPFDPHKVIGSDQYTTASSKLTTNIDFFYRSVTTSTDLGHITSDIQTIQSMKYDS